MNDISVQEFTEALVGRPLEKFEIQPLTATVVVIRWKYRNATSTIERIAATTDADELKRVALVALGFDRL